MQKTITLILFALVFFLKPLHSEVKGKIDIGPVLVDIDVLESGHTIQTQHMKGLRGDATIVVWNGIFLKPTYTWAQGDGRLSTGGIAIGQCIPAWKGVTIMPSVGVAFSSLRSKIDVDTLNLSNLTQKFRSTSPYISLECAYQFAEKWTIMGTVQYAWAHTKTTVKPLFSDKSRSNGPSYALGIEYSLNKNWSVTLAGAYNIALSHEKHGIRAKGVKLGLAYYF